MQVARHKLSTEWCAPFLKVCVPIFSIPVLSVSIWLSACLFKACGESEKEFMVWNFPKLDSVSKIGSTHTNLGSRVEIFLFVILKEVH